MSSRQAYFYSVLQRDPSTLGTWLGKLRLMTAAQRLGIAVPLLVVAAAVVLAGLVLTPARAPVGWLRTGGGDLRAFALVPGRYQLQRDQRGPRLHLDKESLFLKYRPGADGEQVQLHTPHGAAVSRGAVFFVEVTATETRVGVQRGEVVYFTSDQQATFAGPGDLLVATDEVCLRTQGEHRHFAFLDLFFPRLGAASDPASVATPQAAPSAPAAAVAATKTAARARAEGPVAREAHVARRTAQSNASRRARGLLPRKPPRPAAPPPGPRTASPQGEHGGHEDATDSLAPTAHTTPSAEDLGAPVIISLEQAGQIPAPPLPEARPELDYGVQREWRDQSGRRPWEPDPEAPRRAWEATVDEQRPAEPEASSTQRQQQESAEQRAPVFVPPASWWK